MRQINGADAITRRQHAVKSRGRTAALDVSQHHGPRFKAGAGFNLSGERIADAAQPDMIEFVSLSALVRLGPRGKLGALSHHHDAEVAPTDMAPREDLSHITNLKRSLKNQDYIGPAGAAAIDGYPAGVAAHHCHHDHAV